jgi:hypothetical protein
MEPAYWTRTVDGNWICSDVGDDYEFYTGDLRYLWRMTRYDAMRYY